MRRRVAQSKPEIIGAILRKVLKKRNIPHTSTDQRLIDLWTAAVGPQIAARTLPEAIKRGTLYVRVSSPVWLHQLQFLKEEILGKVNELSGREEIRSLHLSIGEVPSPAAGRAESSAAAPSSAPGDDAGEPCCRHGPGAPGDPGAGHVQGDQPPP
jgi:predicted nucleic acid-binding Zn ribbon protein